MKRLTGVTRRGEKGRLVAAAVLLGILTVIALLAPPTHALTTISQSYVTTKDLPVGSIVSLKKDSTDNVEPANLDNADNIFGITINISGSLLTISGTKGQQVQVATQGLESVLVSDYNGKVLQGDAITASPIAGVGMKATTNVRVVGVAQADMKAGSKQTYKTKSGEQKTVTVDQIPTLVNVSYFYRQPDKTIIPAGIQNIANSIAGKKVDSLPVIVSAAVFVIMLIVVMSIVYSMIRSSIISVGRNPLSQSAVYRDLIQLSALVLAILAVGVGAIYMVLTKL